VLGLDGYEFGVELTVGDELGEVLDDVCLRRDGIRGDDVDVGHLHCLGGGNRILHSDSFPHYSASSTILMHPVMHSWTQMPQPLQ
jgi:hypothetical protein